ncbi:hypothetical protein IPL85_00980 [Candidatus Saccharibacteria bacterium]|nr:MAG: hypothetical protein IPL85_00980 [Candidatus Saccharibacteria bacterium]
MRGEDRFRHKKTSGGYGHDQSILVWFAPAGISMPLLPLVAPLTSSPD